MRTILLVFVFSWQLAFGSHLFLNPDSLWLQVDSLSQAGLPNSALAVVDQLYNRAKQAGDDPELIKAILYRIGLNASFQENFPLPAIQEVKRELAEAREPVSQILHSILGELFWSYYQRNQYRFLGRSAESGSSSEDPATWGARRLIYEIIFQYRESLSDESELQAIPLDQYRAVVERPLLDDGKPDTVLSAHTNLFDFLAYRALQFFTLSDLPVTQSSGAFKPDAEAFFAQAPLFVRYPMKPQGIHARPGDGPFIPAGNDTLSLPWYAIRIYQEVIGFHLNDKNPEELIDWDLQRFAYVRSESTLPGRDGLYLASLRQFEQDYALSPASANISFILAQTLRGEGEKYNPPVSDDHRWDLTSAMDICRNAAGRYPDSRGGKNCLSLIKQIMTPSLNITTEFAIVPDEPALASVAFKNISDLFFRIVKADPEGYPAAISGMTQEDIFRYMVSLEKVKSWQVSLPVTGDYQEHHTEFAFPAIPAGFYLLLASSDSLFHNSSVPFTYQAVWSTGISYISQRNDKGGEDLYLLDRKSGTPLENLRVEAFHKAYDNRTRQYVYSRAGEYRSDESGFLSIPPPAVRGPYTSQILHIHRDKDLLITRPLHVYPFTDQPERTVEQTHFYTDRAIYRPGQTIFFKGIVLDRRGDSTFLKINKKTQVTFVDVNGQKIAGQDFITDEWGSFHGSFIAPSGVLLGSMRIFNESGSISVDVEEFRRPTFEVTFVPVKGNYMLGERITLSGKANGYAGNAIDGATVACRVIRTACYPFWGGWWSFPFPSSPETVIISGTSTTGVDGSFTISFDAIPDGTIPADRQPVFNYLVSASVTDINGETRSAQESISVGYRSLLIGIGIPEKLNLHDSLRFTLTTTNLNGERTPAAVQVKLEKLTGPARTLKERLWARPDTQLMTREAFQAEFPHDCYANDDNPVAWPVEKEVFRSVMNTANDTVFCLTDDGCRMPDAGEVVTVRGTKLKDPGSYKLTLTATDPFGHPVEKILYFTAFDPDSKKVPVKTFNWFVPLTISGEPGKTASFLIGTSEKDIRVIREIRMKDQLISREWFTLTNQQKRIDIPILEAYRGNFSVDFLFVRNNRVFQNSQVVTVPYPNKKLDITFETFRDKLIPGQQEEWRIRIADATGKGAAASFLTTLYDRSLDLFASNAWTFDLYRQYFYGIPWDINDDFKTTGGAWYGSWPTSGFLYRGYDRLNWFGLDPLGYGYYHGTGGKGMREGLLLKADYSMDAESIVAGMESPPVPPMDGMNQVAVPDSGSVRPTEHQRIPVIPLRTDFRETAFFYPAMMTDSSGALFLRFTVPDALTSWKFLGLAYTRNLDIGLVEKTAVTSKDLMVFPNAPRFVRQGDTVLFVARIVNLSDHDITGEARLDLAAAITLQPLHSLILDPGCQLPDSGYGIRDTGYVNRGSRTTDHVPFHIPAGQSTAVSWKLAIPVSTFIGLLQYTVTADAGDFSDGETNLLPVLTNRMLVTETLPLPVNGKGTTGFRFEKLRSSAGEKSLNNFRLTLEFASNPAWYAVQALPALDEVSYRNTDQVFGSFYANALGAHLAGSSQQIRHIFESWKKLIPDGLISDLEKNQELKSALLQETPWVLEASSETENRRKLGLFFDVDNLQQNLSERLAQLLKMQYPSGGWPWFEGMQENRLITLNILSGLGHLDYLGVKYPHEADKVAEMIRKAVTYLDGELVDEYKRLQRDHTNNMNNNHLTPFILKYLYARSFFYPTPVLSQEERGVSGHGEALDYYIAQAKKFWLKQELVSQGMIALALHRIGDQVTPGKIIKSLSERALHSNELGMYWAAGGGYEWYQAPVEIQALLLEAFEEITGESRQVEEMKTWLLKQKQTQMWRTKQATVDACYALLLRGSDLLAGDPGVLIKMGDLVIDPAQLQDVTQEAGTGYFRISWTGDAVKPAMGDVSVIKSSDGIAWGGLFWQYFENLDKITSHETPLRVEKQLYGERTTEAGPVLVRITNDNVQLTGDSVHHRTTAPLHHLDIGDKLIVRLIVTADRTMDFVHLKDMRAAGLEPLPQTPSPEGAGAYPQSLSGYRYQDGLGYYRSITDQATNFFFDSLPKGTWVFEYPLVVNNAGDFSAGIATIQCMYAPEFSAHSEGERIKIR